MMSENHIISLVTAGKYSELQRIFQQQPSYVSKESLGRALCDENVRSRIAIVELLLQHGADVNAARSPHYEDGTALYFACKRGSITMVKLLLKYGAIVNRIKYSPLLIACEERHMSCIMLLLEHGGDPYTVWKHVCATDDSHFLNRLIDQGFDVNKRCTDDSTPMHVACKANSVHVIEVLLSHGADVHAVNSEGQTPLHCALGSLDCVKLLVAHGADFRQPRRDGKKTLDLACDCGYISCFRWLVSQGNITLTLEYNSCADCETSHCIANALTVGMKLNPPPPQCQSCCIFRLFMCGGESVVRKFLLQSDLTKVSCVDIVRKGRYEWLELVLQLGVNPNTVVDNADSSSKDDGVNSNPNDISCSYTPLHYAAELGDVRRAELLIKHGANVNCRLKHDNVTPLMLAVREGVGSVIKLLLTHGADVNIAKRVTEDEEDEEDEYDDRGELLEKTYGNCDGSTPLSKACFMKDLRSVQLLLTYGADPDQILMGNSLLHHLAAEKNGYDCMELLLLADNCADPNITNEKGCTPLHIAVEKQQSQRMVHLLLQMGVDINAVDKKGNTPLHLAFNYLKYRTYRVPLMEILVCNGADVNAVAAKGKTPLVCALNEFDDICVQYLLQHGANVNHVMVSTGRTPLHDTCSYSYCKNERVRCAEWLLAHNAAVNAVDSNGCSALHLSLQYDDSIAMVELLIRHGADINLLDEMKLSPLHVACKYNKYDCVKFLLEHDGGQHINGESKVGLTPLSIVLASREPQKLLYPLLLHGAVPRSLQVHHIMKTKVDGDVLLSAVSHLLPMEQLLESACANGHNGFVEAFFHRSNSTTISTMDFRPAVMTACRQGHVDCLEVMINHGVNVNAAGRDGCSPLYAACMNVNIDITHLLLANGAGQHVASPFSPLHHCCSSNNKRELVKLLIDGAVEVNISVDGVTPLMIAVRRRDDELVKMLLAAGADIYQGYKEITPLYLGSLMNVEKIMSLFNEKL